MSNWAKVDGYVKKEFINPIFNSLKKQNVSDDILMTLFFDCAKAGFFDNLPIHIQTNHDFVKKAINKKLVNYSMLPEELKTTDFISKKMYVFMLEHSLVSMNEKIYPQDKEIALAACKNSSFGLEHLDEKFRKNKDFLVEAVKFNKRIVHQLDQLIVKEMSSNKEEFGVMLANNPELFTLLSSLEQKDSYYLDKMLDSPSGYYIAKNSLKRNNDSEIALKALKVGHSDAFKYINQKYSMIIKKNNTKYNAYEFLKKYLMDEKLNNELSINSTAVKKSKI